MKKLISLLIVGLCLGVIGYAAPQKTKPKPTPKVFKKASPEAVRAEAVRKQREKAGKTQKRPSRKAGTGEQIDYTAKQANERWLTFDKSQTDPKLLLDRINQIISRLDKFNPDSLLQIELEEIRVIVYWFLGLLKQDEFLDGTSGFYKIEPELIENELWFGEMPNVGDKASYKQEGQGKDAFKIRYWVGGDPKNNITLLKRFPGDPKKLLEKIVMGGIDNLGLIGLGKINITNAQLEEIQKIANSLKKNL